MGVLAHSLKSKIWSKCSKTQLTNIGGRCANVIYLNNSSFDYPEVFKPSGKHLGQFLDALEIKKDPTMDPLASSTINLEADQDELTFVTPFPIVNKRRGMRRLRSISVNNVSEISSLANSGHKLNFF